jgi:glucose-1-phosphate thymidylyltransferase
MKIIIPMAGRGSRLRPHTLTVPKPLIPVAGKPIVQRLVEDLASSYGDKIEEIAFIIGDFGADVEKDLLAIAEGLGAKGTIYYQREPLGTAHAILCAAPSLTGNVIVAFADTLFRADFKIDTTQDGIIWVQEVEDPSAYGVVKLDGEGTITDFIEKPDTPVSNLAIVGIYYFRDASYLRSEMQYLLDHHIKEKGEYQLTNALENMKQKGSKFKTGKITEWLDCGNKEAVVHSNQRVLEFKKDIEMLIHASAIIENSTLLEPCYIGEGAVIRNAVVGPHVSIGAKTTVTNAVIRNSIIQNNSRISDVVMENSMIGNNVELSGKKSDFNLGDFSKQ